MVTRGPLGEAPGERKTPYLHWIVYRTFVHHSSPRYNLERVHPRVHEGGHRIPTCLCIHISRCRQAILREHLDPCSATLRLTHLKYVGSQVGKSYWFCYRKRWDAVHSGAQSNTNHKIVDWLLWNPLGFLKVVLASSRTCHVQECA